MDSPLDDVLDGAVLSTCQDGDLAELFVLQRCCWVAEAIVNETLDLPALTESLEDVRAAAREWTTWVVRLGTHRCGGRLVGSVRGRADGAVWHVGRLMVAPDLEGRGLGRWLLAHAERAAPPSCSTFALLTGRRSARNVALYERAGYAIDPVPEDRAVPHAVHLSKARAP